VEGHHHDVVVQLLESEGIGHGDLSRSKGGRSNAVELARVEAPTAAPRSSIPRDGDRDAITSSEPRIRVRGLVEVYGHNPLRGSCEGQARVTLVSRYRVSDTTTANPRDYEQEGAIENRERNTAAPRRSDSSNVSPMGGLRWLAAQMP